MKSPGIMRYAGSKIMIADQIAARIPEGCTFIDACCGAGSLLLAVAPRVAHLTLNDKDPGISALWRYIVHAPDKILEIILDWGQGMTVEDFMQLRDLNLTDPLFAGARAFVLHQTSFRGQGLQPQGGRAQHNPKQNLLCRFKPDLIRRKIAAAHALLAGKTDVLCVDFQALPDADFTYYDPPYYGKKTYRHEFTLADHVRLRDHVLQKRNAWLVSHVENESIRALYSSASIETIETRYYPRQNIVKEMLICPKS